jgi:hypothetical protein
VTASLFAEITGWVAALSFLAAYSLLSAGRIRGDSEAYQWLNVVGAAGFIVNATWNGAWPVAVLNVIWIGIGIAALWGIARRKSSASSA